MHKIFYTLTDEAPLLATYSLKPIIESFIKQAGIELETKDISLAGRIISQFNNFLKPDQRLADSLDELGELTSEPETNLIKLPNISASIPQLKAAITELQSKGFAIPNYPDFPQNSEQQTIKDLYDKIKGSAVNPVIRMGNSERRAPESVKNYVKTHPHWMGSWRKDSKTNVATMSAGDFRHNEKSVVMPHSDLLKIVLVTDTETIVLKEAIQVKEGDVIDATVLEAKALDTFLAAQFNRAKQEHILLSLHLKATMMKVSDPIIFGHAIKIFFQAVFDKYQSQLAAAGIDPNNGLASILAGLKKLDPAIASDIQQMIDDAFLKGPKVAMVDATHGITNLHVPSDVIIDASMPAMIRQSGHMWDATGAQEDTLAVIPDSSYAGIYQTVIDDCRQNGAFDPTTMGTIPNIGLMAQKAEEYGSHDKTFEISTPGTVQVINSDGQILLTHKVNRGDIWRACQTTNAAIIDWIKLAISQARVTQLPTVFWLDSCRSHDRKLINKVQSYLDEYDTTGANIKILNPSEACHYSISRARKGENTISVTGNVLRDYLTDLFPILELGTSAKMLSIVPLMAGGRLFETGAGGSAPKHVQQLLQENYLRWDSLGEFLALAACLDYMGTKYHDKKILVLAKSLDNAIELLLSNEKSPARELGKIDNRGSHFYLALYWAQELAKNTSDRELSMTFKPIAAALEANISQIDNELISVQGHPTDIGGYYYLDPKKTFAVMRPSNIFNQILQKLA